MDAHSEDDPEFATWPHALRGGHAGGSTRPDATLLEKRVMIPNRECDLAIEGAQQIIVEKQTVDAFAGSEYGAAGGEAGARTASWSTAW